MKRVIVTSLGRYYKALETPNLVFYVNYQEGDENASTKAYNHSGELISDNYHATCELFYVLENKLYTKVSRNLLKCFKINLASS